MRAFLGYIRPTLWVRVAVDRSVDGLGALRVAWEGALAVALRAWHGKHQTAGIACPGTGQLDAGS